MHITASAFINDDEGGLHEDYERWLERASRLWVTFGCVWWGATY